MRTLSSLAATALAALAAATPAAATAPDVGHAQFSWSGTDTYTCGAPLQVEGSVSITTTTFFDEAGVAVRTQTLSRAEGTYVAENGRIAWYDEAMNSELDLQTGIQRVTGATVRLTAPGAGVLMNDVGRLVLQTTAPGTPPTILFESGRHPTWEPGAWQVLCDYLAGT